MASKFDLKLCFSSVKETLGKEASLPSVNKKTLGKEASLPNVNEKNTRQKLLIIL